MRNINFLSCKLVKEKTTRYDVNNTLTSPETAYKFIECVCELSSEPEENLMMLTLSTKNTVTGVFTVSKGSLNSSLVHPREVYKRALLNNANSIMIFHNHPSGDPAPSKDDIAITKRLEEAGKIIGIKLLDHLIIGDERFTSLKERGIL